MELSYRHPVTGEWAHDVRDPMGEAQWVFYAPAAAARPARPREVLAVLEIGFGRGLNTAIALRELLQEGVVAGVQAVGYEPCPERTAPWPPCPPEIAPFAPWWGQGVGRWQLPRAVGIEVRRERAAAGLLVREERFDWIFLDLYSPGRHPEDWEPELFRALAAAARPGAALTSYCTARLLRDGLEDCGWSAARIRNPGRRETLRALFRP